MPTAVKTRHPSSKIHKPQKRRSSPGQVRALRQRLGLSQGLLARLLGVSVRSVSGAESQVAVPATMRRNLTQVTRLCEALAEAMESSCIGAWLDEPNEMLGGLKPVEAIERGQFDLVWQVVIGLRSGSSL